jgi:hypothetical protein
LSYNYKHIKQRGHGMTKTKYKTLRRKAKLESPRMLKKAYLDYYHDIDAATILSKGNVLVDTSENFHYSIQGTRLTFTGNGETFERTIQSAVPVSKFSQKT